MRHTLRCALGSASPVAVRRVPGGCALRPTGRGLPAPWAGPCEALAGPGGCTHASAGRLYPRGRAGPGGTAAEAAPRCWCERM